MLLGARRDFARGRSEFGCCGRELIESLPKVGQGLDDVIGSLLRVLQRFTGKFIGSSPTGCQELAGRMLGVHRKLTVLPSKHSLQGVEAVNTSEFLESSLSFL
ncbi:hypothetical protein BHM03_00021833 [Ensete ventricosum]|nr:hypothetical protein BHM03_00021833 [Ensete ventricosum]